MVREPTDVENILTLNSLRCHIFNRYRRKTAVRLHESILTIRGTSKRSMKSFLVLPRTYPSDAEDYLVHITTGTYVVQICLFLLTESRHLPGQCSPARDGC